MSTMAMQSRPAGVKKDYKKKALTRENANSKPRGILQALLPGAKVDNLGKIKINNVGLSRETVVFNVGGTKFETYKSTLMKQPELLLADDEFLKNNFRKDFGDYFFDRDPEMFRAILNFLRTGELHIPSYVCGPAAKMELEFWGIGDDVIERCCWTDYNSWNSTLSALNQLEKDRKGSALHNEEEEEEDPTTWTKVRQRALTLMNIPSSSFWAKVYGWLSLMFVALSIFSFMAETHKAFEYQIEIYENGSEQPTQNASFYSNITTTERTLNVTSRTQSVSVPHPVLEVIDYICLAFFTVEYILRLIFVKKKLQFISSLMGIIDLLAILPDFVAIIIYLAAPELHYEGSVDFIAVLRIARVLRIFRLIRHVPGLWILVYTLKASFKELLLMSAFLMVGMLVFSSLIYFVEDHKTFTSIPHGFWWAIITMTTVGYGDMYPTTNLGYLIGSFTALSGLLMIGFSVPVLVNNFIMYYKHVQFALEEDDMKKKQKDRERARKKGQSLFNMTTSLSRKKDANGNQQHEMTPLQTKLEDPNV